MCHYLSNWFSVEQKQFYKLKVCNTKMFFRLAILTRYQIIWIIVIQNHEWHDNDFKVMSHNVLRVITIWNCHLHFDSLHLDTPRVGCFIKSWLHCRGNWFSLRKNVSQIFCSKDIPLFRKNVFQSYNNSRLIYLDKYYKILVQYNLSTFT